MDAARTLRDARHRAGLTQRALASRTGVRQPAIARIESGAVTPRVDTLDNLLAGCGQQLATERRPGIGVDRTAIRALLRLTPIQRIRLATREGRNLERLLESIEDLISMKRAAGRPKDLIEIEVLGALADELENG